MATIGQVAARAEVSRATVSRVMNATATVSPETHGRVQRAIEALHYRPSALARDLSLGRNTAVAIVATSIGSPLVVPVASRLSEEGLEVALVEAASDSSEALLSIIGRVGGVVAEQLSDPAICRAVVESGVPLVATGPGDLSVSRVVIDRIPAIRAVAAHLAATGHSSATLFDDGELANTAVADLRLMFGMNGLRLTRSLRQLDNLAVALGGRKAPTAVVAANPLLALATFNQARALGYLIPHELSIVALASSPVIHNMRISAVEEPVAQAGAEAVDLLRSLMLVGRGVSPGIEVRLSATYVPGVSTRRAT